MDTKSKVLVALFFALILISAYVVYYRTMMIRDFPIVNEGGQ